MFHNERIYVRDQESLQNKINSFSLAKLQIVADFDSTITKDDGNTSWALFSKSGIMPEEYVIARDAYLAHYYPLEISTELTSEERSLHMREWWTKHLELFIRFKLNSSVIESIVTNGSLMDFRGGMKEFIQESLLSGIPFVILSAGITNTINRFLEHNRIISPDLHVVSNELIFDKDGFCIGINKDVIIHSENKDEHDMPQDVKDSVAGRTDIILLGDSLTDIKMIDRELRDSAITIGFLSDKKFASKEKFRETFDVVIEDNYESHGVPLEILKKIKP